jgi:hypothetical protein
MALMSGVTCSPLYASSGLQINITLWKSLWWWCQDTETPFLPATGGVRGTSGISGGAYKMHFLDVCLSRVP